MKTPTVAATVFVLMSLSFVSAAEPKTLRSGSTADRYSTTYSTALNSTALKKPSLTAEHLNVGYIGDYLYDYEVHVADPATATGWYVRYTYEDGVVLYSSAFATYDGAQDFLVWMLLGGYDPRGSLSDPDLAFPDTAIVSGAKEPTWVPDSIHDRRVDAQAAAAVRQSAGFLTRIVAVPE